MTIYNFKSYRIFIKDFIEAQPNKGRGMIARMAEAIGVHSTLMSLVLSGDRDLSLEQSYDLANFLQLTDAEAEYFSFMVQVERAGNHRYKLHLQKKMEALKTEATKLSTRFQHEKKLSETDRTTFYSSWIFSAIRLYCSVNEKGVSFDELQKHFEITRQRLIEILDFLTRTGLVVEEKNKYKMGTQRTFVEFGSPHLLKHHSNWRIKSLSQAELFTADEMMFTSPISLSKEDFTKIREMLAQSIKEVSQIVKDSPAEDVACLNIDLFWVRS